MLLGYEIEGGTCLRQRVIEGNNGDGQPANEGGCGVACTAPLDSLLQYFGIVDRRNEGTGERGLHYIGARL